MSNLEKRPFPYSDIDVTVVRKEDIIKTIEANITDKEVALELISHIEINAEKTLLNHGWAGYPFLGSIRIPPGLSEETLSRNRPAQEWAYQNMNREEYLMFMRQNAHENAEINRYRGYFETIAERNIKAHRKEYNIICSNKGKTYAKLFITFKYALKPDKPLYEYIYELDEENNEVNNSEDDRETDD